MIDSPMLRAAKILHENGLGRLKDIHEKLNNVPASFGPISEHSHADRLGKLLLDVGVITCIQEHGAS